MLSHLPPPFVEALPFPLLLVLMLLFGVGLFYLSPQHVVGVFNKQ